jgi:hypothetical protein
VARHRRRVFGDVKQHGVDQETQRQVFLPIVQQPRMSMVNMVSVNRGDRRSTGARYLTSRQHSSMRPMPSILTILFCHLIEASEI